MSQKIKIAVLVSGRGTNLQALMDAEAAGKIPSGTITLVVSDNPNAQALVRADQAGVPAVTILRTPETPRAEFEANLQKELELAGIEMIILAGFLGILSKDFCDRWYRRIINVHPSLLPAFGGKGFYGIRVHRAVIARGVKLTGATVHYVNEVTDGGDIISQKEVEVLPGDTPETLQQRVLEQAEWVLICEAAEKVSARLLKEKAEQGGGNG